MNRRVEFSFCPNLVIDEGSSSLINANVQEEQRPIDQDNPSLGAITYWTADSVRVYHPLEYGKIISAFVRLRYSADDVEAITLNAGDGNPDHDRELQELQSWRAEAKRIAKEVLQ